MHKLPHFRNTTWCSKVGESEGLFVRGGTGTETKFLWTEIWLIIIFGNSVPELNQWTD